MAKPKKISPLVIKDCVISTIATGRRAQSLREFRDQIEAVDPESIYIHFLGGMMTTGFEDPEYPNDFAAWARHGLHDPTLAERLALIDPAEFDHLEDLRRELIETVEDRLDEKEYVPWSKREEQFYFFRSQVVIFDSGKRVHRPEDLYAVIGALSAGSIFYHFIDARRRNKEAVDDVRIWLKQFGEEYVFISKKLEEIDPYFLTLSEMRTRLQSACRIPLSRRARR